MRTPMQVWGPFRQESYKRHKIIGKIVMASLLGAYATASVIALGLLGSDEWAEKVLPNCSCQNASVLHCTHPSWHLDECF